MCLPFAGRPVQPKWAVSLATLYPPMNCNHSFVVCEGVKRDHARNGLVEKALKLGVKYILFIDDDTAPPPHAVQHLMYQLDNSEDDVAVCAGVYMTKSDPPQPTILMSEGTGPHWKWRIGEVFPCYAIGTGCMMIRASVFEKIEKPWFVDVETPDQARELGLLTPEMEMGKDLGSIDRFMMTDDVYFCRKLNQAGYKVLAHGGVICRHFGQDGKAYDLPPDSYPVLGRERHAEQMLAVLSPEVTKLKALYPFPEEKPDVGINTMAAPIWSSPLTEDALVKLVPRDAKVIVELGTWLGHGALKFAALAPDAAIICVDHWLGSAEHYQDAECRKMLPKLYRAFCTNVWDQRDRIVPMKTTTWAGLQELHDLGVKPDLIYVDASHKYEDVKEDIRLSRELFPNAILCGDDADWEDVKLAVSEEAGDYSTNGRCWWAKARVEVAA
jgi:predicted O-methyltransferase YrrM